MEAAIVLATLFGGSFLVFVVRQRWFTPRLRLSMRSEQFGKMKTETAFTLATIKDGILANRQEVGESLWIRLSVQNVGYGVAMRCRAYLAGVQLENEDQSKSPERRFWDCIPLGWACDIGEIFDVPKGIHGTVDVLKAYSIDNTIQACVMYKPPMSFAEIFRDHGIYRITVVVSAENARPRTYYVRIRWNGKWNEVAILNDISTETTDDMR